MEDWQPQPPAPAAQPVCLSVCLPFQWADWLPTSPLTCFLNCHCARLSACCCQAFCRSDCPSAVGLSIHLPFQCSDGLPITQATATCLYILCQSVCLSSSGSGWLLICFSVCLCAFLCLPGHRSIMPTYLSARPSHLVIPHPHFSARVELGSLITKAHVSLPSAGWLPPGWRSGQASKPRSPRQPSSPCLHPQPL